VAILAFVLATARDAYSARRERDRRDIEGRELVAGGDRTRQTAAALRRHIEDSLG
jgi:hypothetical protein